MKDMHLRATYPSHLRSLSENVFQKTLGRRTNGFLGVSLNERTILYLVILSDKTVSVGKDSLSRIRQSLL